MALENCSPLAVARGSKVQAICLLVQKRAALRVMLSTSPARSTTYINKGRMNEEMAKIAQPQDSRVVRPNWSESAS